MTRADTIATTLLDLNEDLEAKLPVLLKQFADDFNEQQIRQIATADPTGNRAEYITWLLRMRRGGGWSGDIEAMREILTKYNAVKRKPRFTRIGGKTDINQYGTVNELEQDINRALAGDLDTPEARQGTKMLSKHGEFALFKITNFAAARKIAIEPGDPAPDNADFSAISEHAGTGEPGWPWAGWCTQMEAHYRTYANAPLYTIKKGKYPFIQISFAHPQYRDIKNGLVQPDVNEAILPLFNVPEFDFLASTRVDEKKLKKKLVYFAKSFINRNVGGYEGKQGHVPPTVKTQEEAIAKLVPKIPQVYKMFRDIVDNWDRPVDDRDRQIKAEIKSDANTRQYGELQSLVNSIAASRPTDTLPAILQSPEAFAEAFQEILANL